MRTVKASLLATVLAFGALGARDAAACGGCFVGPSQVTQITGEKMLLTISQTQTTLYDEITYSGDPSSFAWVLPIKGLATVGLSSDALFQNLGLDTQATVIAPQINCPSGCNNGGLAADAPGSSSGAGGASGGGMVTVVSQEVVGPYETVQLMSTDPTALRDWLAAHQYNVAPADGPVIDAYTAEGFNFLALKLVPGQGVSAMRPVRVTTPGATPTLPLRMVAVGSGPIVPITLWVLAEGRYDTVNLPYFQIDPTKLVWDWDTQSSNYAELKQAGFTASNNTAWLLEAAEPFSMYQIQSQLEYLVQTDPVGSGYADAMGNGADQALTDDMTTLFTGISETSAWITRYEGALSHAALANDLQIAASSDQSQVNRTFFVTTSTGTAPLCPAVTPCGGGGGTGGFSTGSPPGWTFYGTAGGSVSGGGGCAVTSTRSSEPTVLAGLGVLAALALARRRARRA
jgi:MYXO-CTERM domain-containing protein